MVLPLSDTDKVAAKREAFSRISKPLASSCCSHESLCLMYFGLIMLEIACLNRC